MRQHWIREEINRRGWSILERDGRRAGIAPFSRTARVGEFTLHEMGNNTPAFYVTRVRNSDGQRSVEYYSTPGLGRAPDYDEWSRILDAMRKVMILEDLSEVEEECPNADGSLPKS